MYVVYMYLRAPTLDSMGRRIINAIFSGMGKQQRPKYWGLLVGFEGRALNFYMNGLPTAAVRGLSL